MNLFRRSGPDTGYYSDRNDARNGFRDERGYLSDHSSRWAEVTDNNIKHETYPASSHQDIHVHFRGLAPHFLKQDSIRSGYISDHESRSGYEHRGEQGAGRC